MNISPLQVDEQKVLLVECGSSQSPCYLEHKEFYVRTNPSTDKLEGPKLVEYIKESLFINNMDSCRPNYVIRENIFDMPYDRSPDLLDKEVVYEFFWKFSVFECALTE